MSNSPDKIQSILVRGTNWLGDAVMTTPALRRLRASFPQSHIALLATPRTAELFSAAPFVDEVIVYRRKEEGAKAFFSATSALRERRFCLALLFQNAFEAALLSLLGRVPRRVGYAMQGRGPLLTHALHHTPAHRNRHQIHDYLDIVLEAEKICEVNTTEPMTDKEKDTTPTLIANETHQQAAAQLLQQIGIVESKRSDQPSAVSSQPDQESITGNSSAEQSVDSQFSILHSPLSTDRPLIALNTSATNSRAKCWPEDRFAAVADELIEKLHARIIFIGAASERAGADNVIARMKKSGAFNLAGKTTMIELIGLLNACALLISNDTGPAHVSAALGRPTLTIFGPTNEFETAPLGTHAEIIRAENIECARCMHRDCPIDHRCMTRISIAEVIRQAMRVTEHFS